MKLFKTLNADTAEERRVSYSLRLSALSAFICLFVGNAVFAQPDPDLKTAKFLGAKYCSNCHDDPKKFPQSADFILVNEFLTWKNEDKHSRAYQALKNPTSQRMAKILASDVTRDGRCLNCHSMNFPEPRRGDQFTLEDGVSCDGCHGPAQHWIGPHSQRDWRTKTPEQKSKLGMLDIRNPVTRTNMCLSCHVGNVEEKKIVTHEMYAAGHPPLPSFEVATFSHDLPRHWRKRRDVPYLKAAPPEIQKQYQYDPDELEEAKLVLLGGVLALRETADMLADQAGKPDWPELAQFDCYACHHDLKKPSWRQERGYLGKPGRPGLRYWPMTIPATALPLAGVSNDEFAPRLRPLQAALDAQPFGKPAEIAVAARGLSKHCDEVVDRLIRLKCDQAVAKKALAALSNHARMEQLDFDSARQAAWSFQAIYGELSAKPPNDAELQAALTALKKELRLELPSGAAHEIVDFLPKTLDAMADYEADRVRRQMDVLFKLISKAD